MSQQPGKPVATEGEVINVLRETVEAVSNIDRTMSSNQRLAFELGFRWCERGMTLTDALAKFDKLCAAK